MNSFETLLETHTREEIQRYEELKTKLETLSDSIEGLNNAWQQALGIIGFIKWFSAIAGGLTALLLYIKGTK